MIRLNVTTYNGQPVSQPLTAQFDELGGDIGRADTNQLVLPDPERTISRVHARVLFRAFSPEALRALGLPEYVPRLEVYEVARGSARVALRSR